MGGPRHPYIRADPVGPVVAVPGTKVQGPIVRCPPVGHLAADLLRLYLGARQRQRVLSVSVHQPASAGLGLAGGECERPVGGLCHRRFRAVGAGTNAAAELGEDILRVPQKCEQLRV